MTTVEATVAYINAHYTWGQPGWQLTAVYETAYDQGMLWVTGMVRDTYQPDNPALNRVTHQFTIPPWEMLPEALDGFVRECIHAAATHEADEWFRKDGVMIFNPHRTA